MNRPTVFDLAKGCAANWPLYIRPDPTAPWDTIGEPDPLYEEVLLATSNLIAYWPLSADGNDAVGANNGAATGAIAYGQEGIGNSDYGAATFGSGKYLKLESTPITTPPLGVSEFTLIAWVKRAGAGTTVSTGTGGVVAEPIFTKGRGESETATLNMNFFLGIDPATGRAVADFEESSGPNIPLSGGTDVTDGEWHMIAATYDGANLKLYLDGAPDGQVANANGPDALSKQPACIGTAMNSSAAALGAFNGDICHVSLHDAALDAAGIAALYEAGAGPPQPYVQYDAEDTLIDHGDDWGNWVLTGDGTTADSGGLTIIQDTSPQETAGIDIAGLEPETQYWLRVQIDAELGAAGGNLRLEGFGSDGSNIQAVSPNNGIDYDFAGGTGQQYVLVETDDSAGPYHLAFRYAGGTVESSGLSISRVDLISTDPPPRSAAKVAVIGDRTGGYNSAVADAVDAAILAAGADTVNLIAMGDMSDTANAHTINDALKGAIELRGGNMWSIPGNHDYDGVRENEFATYWDGPQAGAFNWYAKLGEVLYIGIDDWTASIGALDNGGGYAASGSDFEDSAVGDFVRATIAANPASWVVLLVHHAAYSSGTPASGGWAACRWDFKGMGVHAVFQAHVHGLEAILQGGMLYMTNARGGGSHHGWATALASTLWREEDTGISGFVRVSDTPTQLIFEFFNTDNELIYRHKLLHVTP